MKLNRELLSMNEVATVVFVSREEALAEFRDDLPPEDAELLDALRTNPLPNSFWITLKSQYRERASLAYFAGQVTQLPGVEEVRYGKDFVDKFAGIIRGVYYVDMQGVGLDKAAPTWRVFGGYTLNKYLSFEGGWTNMFNISDTIMDVNVDMDGSAFDDDNGCKPRATFPGVKRCCIFAGCRY